MKYKVLLMGENNAVIDDFFLRMGNDYEIVTTSTRRADIINHLKVFAPDIFVYCINMNSYKDYNSIYFLKERLIRLHTPLAVIGSEEECNDFKKVTMDMADITLVKPLTAEIITKKIDAFMSTWQENHTSQNIGEIVTESKAVRADELAKENEKQTRKHILVIDDDSLMLKMVNEQLHDTYDVATAISGKLALKFLEKKRTDLILLDYEMPGDNGPTVLRKLRENPETKDIPVVFLTGVSQRERIQEVLLMKPQGYLLKPIDIEKLTNVIEGLLDK